MAAPSFASIAPKLSGSSSGTAAVPIPTGVVAGSFVMVYMFEDPNNAVTPSSGFAEAPGSPVTNSSLSKPHRLHIFWKRAAGTELDTDTYPFTVNTTGLDWRQAWAVRYTGVITSGNPFDFTTTNTADSGPSPMPSVSGTTLGADRLLINASSTYDGRIITSPSGFTQRTTADVVEVSDKVQTTGGATGSINGTFAGSNTSSTVWLAALKPVGAVTNTAQFFTVL